ncbi:MAG: hypothetical protein ABI282_05165 [Candidatus Baltobacteraceae bacterium]
MDARSPQYVQSMIDAGNTGGFWIAAVPVEFVNVAGPRTPKRFVRPKVTYHHFDVAYPWDPGFKIEPLSDAHAIVVESRTCDLYETYETTYENGVLSAYSGWHWSLRRPFSPLPAGTPSAMASGLSLYAGMVRFEEVASGSIDHALNWGAPAGTAATRNFVRPASDTDGLAFKGLSRYALPYGAHLRLRASFDTSRFGPQSKIIAQAMKTYGIYLADTGGRGNALYNAAALDGSNHWNASDLAALDAIHISDFEVLTLGPVGSVR